MIIQGRHLIITIDGEAIAAAKSCEVNIQSEMIRVSSPTDGGWDHSIAGRKSWSASCSHLVVLPKAHKDMVGRKVTLRFKLMPTGTQPPIAGIEAVNPIYVQDVVLGNPRNIIWDTNGKRFLSKRSNTSYFTTWANQDGYFPRDAYLQAHDFAKFIDPNNNIYVYYDGDLTSQDMEGEAWIKTWKGTFTLGNLAQGSFQFEGNGPLE